MGRYTKWAMPGACAVQIDIFKPIDCARIDNVILPVIAIASIDADILAYQEGSSRYQRWIDLYSLAIHLTIDVEAQVVYFKSGRPLYNSRVTRLCDCRRFEIDGRGSGYRAERKDRSGKLRNRRRAGTIECQAECSARRCAVLVIC